ncbi:hypothetical protein [Nitratireductor indicus]|uniref:hypothetical protein n=1 Tax=Nitratireductor indicus TaxID=721133 RepID=UPI002875BCC0|nr:hypothetical protein [Nitratireductor indicus]MDS1138592.1 hypothetical protein [Nitratireductor indicus]
MMEAATWKRRQKWIEPVKDEHGNIEEPGYWMTDPDVSIDDARRPEHGSVIHAWKEASDRARKKAPESASQVFTSLHLETARRVHEVFDAYCAAIALRTPRSASDYSSSGGFDGTDPFDDDRSRRDVNAIARWMECRRAILESGPMGMMAVEAIVFENKPVHSLMGDLRLALNEVDRVWRRQRAA